MKQTSISDFFGKTKSTIPKSNTSTNEDPFKVVRKNTHLDIKDTSQTNSSTSSSQISIEDPKENDNVLIVFTDGAAKNNSRTKTSSKAGYGVAWPYHPEMNIGRPLSSREPQTNNRAEFMALIVAYEQANQMDPQNTKTLHVYTDSKLLIDTMTSWRFGWKKNSWKKSDGSPVQNLDLVKTLDNHIQTRKTIFKHVRAHTGKATWEARFNDLADQLARSSATHHPNHPPFI